MPRYVLWEPGIPEAHVGVFPNVSRTFMSSMDELSDGDLISLYVNQKNEQAMRALVSRHQANLHARFRRELPDEADARDLQQQLWLKVVGNLSNYKDEGKFANYLSRIAGNLITDFRRGKGRQGKVIASNESIDGVTDTYDMALNEMPVGGSADSQSNEMANDELVEYLVKVLIPALPVEQRTAWLLQHESEYWDYNNRLDWKHLAELNGLDVDEVWNYFESAREKLIVGGKATATNTHLEEIESLIFLVWTQAQRLKKESKFTWDYFAHLLGVPQETMKTRYRSARLTLGEGLKQQMQ